MDISNLPISVSLNTSKEELTHSVVLQNTSLQKSSSIKVTVNPSIGGVLVSWPTKCLLVFEIPPAMSNNLFLKVSIPSLMKILWPFTKKFLKEKLNSLEPLISKRLTYWTFKSYFFRNAKSLVKHLLVSDLTKRYGNLKGGIRINYLCCLISLI